MDLTYEVRAYADPVWGGWWRNSSPNCQGFSQTLAVPDGWQVDVTKGDPGHPGISARKVADDPTVQDSLRSYFYGPHANTGGSQLLLDIEGNSFRVTGNMCDSDWPDVNFDRFYVIHLIQSRQ